MNEPWTDVTILCKVVDNYGDIGFVYRLARSLSRLEPAMRLRIVVSDLISFAKMAPGLLSNGTGSAEQSYNGWTVLDWNNSAQCTASYEKNPPKVILECFQCGRPEWLDSILFSDKRTEVVHILNVEYLTAEKWADDFHLLKSGTRSILVKKVNFMPGFSAKTGGLVLDEPFVSFMHNREFAKQTLLGAQSLSNREQSLSTQEQSCVANNQTLSPADISLFGKKNVCTVVVFSYPRDFTPVVQALAEYEALMKKNDPDFSVHVFLANGICREPFLTAYHDFFGEHSDGILEKGKNNVEVVESPFEEKVSAFPKKESPFEERETPIAITASPFAVTELPFLSQSKWDALLTLADVLFVRGEDSLSRASLTGKPFFWHAYPQKEEYQLVKVQALLDVLEPYFSKEDFTLLSKFWLLYNTTENTAGGVAGSMTKEDVVATQKTCLLGLLDRLAALTDGFSSFSAMLEKNGDLGKKLIEYLKQLQF